MECGKVVVVVILKVSFLHGQIAWVSLIIQMIWRGCMNIIKNGLFFHRVWLRIDFKDKTNKKLSLIGEGRIAPRPYWKYITSVSLQIIAKILKMLHIRLRKKSSPPLPYLPILVRMLNSKSALEIIDPITRTYGGNRNSLNKRNTISSCQKWLIRCYQKCIRIFFY